MESLLNNHLKNWLRQLLTRGGCLQDSCQDDVQPEPDTIDNKIMIFAGQKCLWKTIGIIIIILLLSNSQFNIHVHAAVACITAAWN